MDWFIIGTAGHVDHGKTQLVKVLTGQDTDRLKEEKKRGISIELGFAPLKLQNGKHAAIIDVPGHERFIKQMLAGVAGIDIVMLVVAADEGVMPQTREHLDIIELLQIKKGLVVITKIDLVDEEWLELVEDDVQSFLKGTVLEDAPILKVSAVKKQGIEQLMSVITAFSEKGFLDLSRKGHLRLPVDRSFTLSGFGTVITGTLWVGEVRAGDIVEVQPSGKKTRVRSVQVHGKPQEVAVAGQRVALNLSDLEVWEVPRGSTVVHLGSFEPSYLLDARLRLVKGAASPLRQRQRVRVHLGTSEKLARVKLLDVEELQPGADSYVQLQMEEPLIAQRGDRFVIRSYSPMHTIGGGMIVEPQAQRLKKHDQAALDLLKIKEENDPRKLVKVLLDTTTNKLLTKTDLSDKLKLPPETIEEALKSIGEVVLVEGEGVVYLTGKQVEEKWLKQVLTVLEEYHAAYPLRLGVDREELRSRFFARFSIRELNALLGHWRDLQKLAINKSYLSKVGFLPLPDDRQKRLIEDIEAEFIKGDFQPPGWEDIIQEFNLKAAEKDELLRYLLGNGNLIKAAEGMFFHKETVAKAKEILRRVYEKNGEIVLSEMRDTFKSTRRYILPLLEYLDAQKFTRRIGDKRIIQKA
jgi:selenocysteine-specific elongation factor